MADPQSTGAVFLPQEFIRRKRDGGSVSAEDIEAYIRGVTDGSVTEGQVAAFSMAVFFQGMSLDERVALTRAMTNMLRTGDEFERLGVTMTEIIKAERH